MLFLASFLEERQLLDLLPQLIPIDLVVRI
jgi:hypothetical protein